MTTRARRWAVAALGVAGFFGLVEVLAWANVRRERARRSPLSDRLFVVERGAGPPIVFLAGLQGSTRYWGATFDDAASQHRLLFLDALGFGRSPWPLREPTLEDHLQWLRRTLLAHGATSHVTVVAHSFGTILAAYYAARYPTEVDRLVLLGTPIFRGEEEARHRIRELSSLGGLFALNPIVAREACLLMGASRPLLEVLLPHLSSRYRPEVVEDAVLHDWPSIHGAIQNVLLRSPIEPALQKVRATIVFIHGERDPVTPLDRVREVATSLHASLLVVPGDHAGYVPASRDAVMAALLGVSAPQSPLPAPRRQ